LNEQQPFVPNHHLYFSRGQASVKKPLAHVIGLDTVVGIFLKTNRKNEEGIVPWVAPEQGASLHWCKDARCSAPSVIANM
jgi:hypothetical protein